MKAVVAALNQEKALLSRGVLSDYEPSDGHSFESLITTHFVVALNILNIQNTLKRFKSHASISFNYCNAEMCL